LFARYCDTLKREMLTVPETVEDELVVAKCYAELGNVTKEKGELDESLRYHRKSMEIFERMDDALSVADSHLNIAEIYKAKGELKQAMSEYEIGLTLYEDLYVEDVSKNSDSGTDVSLNSSFISDLQHTRALSKSDETLPQTTLTDIIENDVPPSSPRFASNCFPDMLLPSIEILSPLDDTPQTTTYTDYSSLISSENMVDELWKSFSSSHTANLQYNKETDGLLPSSLSDFMYDTTVETTPEQSNISEICPPFLPPLDPMNQELLLQTMNPLLFDTKLEENNDNKVNDLSGLVVLFFRDQK
jgi:tetratricopeptide (TPR) repeat protein